MVKWKEVKTRGLDVLLWWENVVKPGVKKIAQKCSRDMNREKFELLNLLRLRQSYLHRKMISGEMWRRNELLKINRSINTWYENECEKIKFQSEAANCQRDE